MCTGFISKGDDLIAGFNFDLAAGAWDYKVYAKPDMFYIGIKVGGTVYRVHGVNKNGNFGNLPYMNAPDKGVYRRGKGCKRLDLLMDGYISGKYSYADILDIVTANAIVNVPNASMHSLIADGDGRMMLIEPGLGCRELTGGHAIISNFPLLEQVEDLSPKWYGKDRYDRGAELLNSSGGFCAADGLALLREVRQEGEWATRVSFVYSKNESAVYYVQNNDFDNVIKHPFK